MPRHQGTVLVDTNVIIEAHRIGAWRALAGGYRLATVERCVSETQEGAQHRRPEQTIDLKVLRDSLNAVHAVSDTELATLYLKISDIALDGGEQALWAHALGRNDDWILCGPDKASLLAGVHLGLREKLVSLEDLLTAVGYNPREIRSAYSSRWLADTINQIVITVAH